MEFRLCQHQNALMFCPLKARALKQSCLAMARALPKGIVFPSPMVEVHLVRDGMMAAANQRYMGCLGATNVLSFPGAENLAGVLLLSVDTLLREALLYGQEPQEHCIRLLAHGMGHLLGYDHGDAMEALCACMEEAALLVCAG
jgi:probable rRNA maturation factor